MITSISLHNYKAFENVSIPIKPLTIFLGANSVGKSSIIQMLMLLHQTAEEQGQYSSALKIYGNYVNVGAFENLFRDKDVSRPFSVRLELTSDEVDTLLRNCKNEFVRKFCNTIYSTDFSSDKKSIKRIKSREDFQDFLESYFSEIKQKKLNNDDHLLSFIRYRLDWDFDPKNDNNVAEVLRCYDFRNSISKNANSNYSVLFQFIEDKKQLKIDKVSFSFGDNHKLIEIDSLSKNINIYSDFELTIQDKEFISNYLNFKNTIFDVVSDDFDSVAYYDLEEKSTDSIDKHNANRTLVSAFILRICRVMMKNIQNELYGDNINYVSPLRAHPKRYYMLDKAKMTISLDTLDGDAIAEVLKENKSLKEKVNNWFSKFGFKIEVEMFKEVIHQMHVSQNGLTLDITDVGFGISQVLPIIIQGFLSSNESITVIEQPEIHLHPRMQADLGDLFIDIVNTDKKQLIIETHSEYLLRRIRRRISEGKISSNDVAICLFHPREGDTTAWVENLRINEKGSFEWPEDFYGGELYNDTLEYLKNQA